MVKKIIFLWIGSSLLSSCALKDWWGETTQRSNTIQTSPVHSPCLEFSKILSSNEETSQKTFNCWKNELSSAWTHLHPKEKDALSSAEIRSLVKSEVLHLPGDPKLNAEKFVGIKKLFGHLDLIRKSDLEQWILWAETHRSTLRLIYEKWNTPHRHILYSDIENLLEITASALKKANWNFTSDEIAEIFTQTMSLNESDFYPVARPITHVALDLMNMLCPLGAESKTWSALKISECISLAARQFSGAHRWVEFLINPTETFNKNDQEEVFDGVEAFLNTAETWFKQQGFSSFHTLKWWEFAKSLGINVTPEEFAEDLFLIQKWTHGTTEILPADFAIKVARATGLFQKFLISGIIPFIESTQQHRCVNPETQYWLDCVPSQAISLRKNIRNIDLFFRIKNPNHGGSHSAMSGYEFGKMMLYYTLAGEVIRTFDDDQDGIILAHSKDNSAQAIRAITAAVNFSDLWTQFIENIQKKWNSIPIKKFDSTAQFVKKLNPQGFAELITMTSEVLVQRSPENKSFIDGLIANITNTAPSGAYYLDQMSITAVFSSINTLPDYREEIIGIHKIDKSTSQERVERALVIKNIPDWLKIIFPRTYSSCNQFGFELSCGTVLQTLLPLPLPEKSEIAVSDIDILTIYAITMEGILDHCDRNGDGKLSWDLFDGNDELDCGFTQAGEITKRLVNSQVVKTSSADQKRINLLINTIDSFFLSRVIGKTAMVRGTAENAWINLPLFWLFNGATLGTMYGLTGNVISK